MCRHVVCWTDAFCADNNQQFLIVTWRVWCDCYYGLCRGFHNENIVTTCWSVERNEWWWLDQVLMWCMSRQLLFVDCPSLCCTCSSSGSRSFTGWSKSKTLHCRWCRWWKMLLCLAVNLVSAFLQWNFLENLSTVELTKLPSAIQCLTFLDHPVGPYSQPGWVIISLGRVRLCHCQISFTARTHTCSFVQHFTRPYLFCF